MAHPRDKEGLLHLYNKVLPPLAEKTFQHLQEVIPLFDDFKLEKVLDTWSKDKNASSEKEISLENGNVQQMGLRVQLTGFQKAGAQTFDVSKDLVFFLEYSSYIVGPDKNTAWLERFYLQPWSARELEEIAEKWTDEVIEEITHKLQGLG
ncbi:hypothetical protein TH63_08075 [Rufibacter radiotolerans]|uniref:Uncharacterized protein n=1 Tax=Rufibacter radiotolerans TaxID=1379910 RepID=A0A0H4W5E1_9BACT|nr:hypothetical protein [Rufibacter radiotolerans]AKQ45616.1 hypothetical protein TH63_08075 [Rufibacter radiotolerans]